MLTSCSSKTVKLPTLSCAPRPYRWPVASPWACPGEGLPETVHARGGMSASAAARRAAEAAGRAPLVLGGSRMCSKAGEEASCTHRESGQSDDVSGTAVCASARSVCRRAAVCLRCARVPQKRVGWRGASSAAVGCAHLAAAEVARARTEAEKCSTRSEREWPQRKASKAQTTLR